MYAIWRSAGPRYEDTRRPEPEPRYDRFIIPYPSGTVIEAFYAGGATLREVQVLHPMATVEVAEEGK